MHNYQKKLYQLKDELTRMSKLFKGGYNIKYVDKWITRSFEENMKPDIFYQELEHDYNITRQINNKLYHTIAIMLIYCS